jgi:LTXXQ motif family protein
MEVAMTICKKMVAAAVIAAGFAATAALAQSPGSSPPQTSASPQTQAAPGSGFRGNMPMWHQQMMGWGGPGAGWRGMGPGMMGGAGMGWGMGRWGMADHVEGWLAFLKTELKITPSQEKQWDAVAGAMKANVASMQTAWRGMSANEARSLPERLAAREQLMTARLEALRQLKAAIDPLYAALSDEQKKSADELMPGMGAGAMGWGMMGRLGSL